MCEKFAVESKVIPITDNTLETRIKANGEDLHLQEFWVKHRGRGTIEGIEYVGADKARPNPDAISAIQDAELVVIAPGNPLTSIGPMMGIKGVRKELTKNKKKVVAVSPLIGNKSFSGPADKYMEAAGIEVSVFGLAQFYADVCSKMIIDTKDKALASKIQGLDIQVLDTKIKMQNKAAEGALAGFILKQLKL
jgi:LPPG:FO 2-phospho-L-lactate transferase